MTTRELTCAEARQALREGERTPEAEAHLRRCPACALLCEDPSLAGALPAPSDLPVPELADLYASLERAVQADARSVRGRLSALSTRWRACVAGAIVATATLLGAASLRPDLAAYPIARFLAELLSLVVLGALLVALWLRPLQRRALPRWVEVIATVTALLGPTLLLPVLSLFGNPGRLAPIGGATLRHAVPCLVFAALLGLPVAGIVSLLGRSPGTVVMRRLAPLLAGGLVGLAGLHLHCPNQDPWHLLLGHAALLPIIGAVGALTALLADHLAARRRPPRPPGGPLPSAP